MPIYEYYCKDCNNDDWEAFHDVDYRNKEKCPDCAKPASIAMSVPGRPVIIEYYSENLQSQVTGPAQKRQLMKAKGVEEAG